MSKDLLYFGLSSCVFPHCGRSIVETHCSFALDRHYSHNNLHSKRGKELLEKGIHPSQQLDHTRAGPSRRSSKAPLPRRLSSITAATVYPPRPPTPPPKLKLAQWAGDGTTLIPSNLTRSPSPPFTIESQANKRDEFGSPKDRLHQMRTVLATMHGTSSLTTVECQFEVGEEDCAAALRWHSRFRAIEYVTFVAPLYPV